VGSSGKVGKLKSNELELDEELELDDELELDEELELLEELELDEELELFSDELELDELDDELELSELLTDVPDELSSELDWDEPTADDLDNLSLPSFLQDTAPKKKIEHISKIKTCLKSFFIFTPLNFSLR